MNHRPHRLGWHFFLPHRLGWHFFVVAIFVNIQTITTATNLRRVLPLNRGNGGEPPGTINNLIPNADSPYVMDLHPQKRQAGQKVGTPCGLTSGVLYDLYGSKRLDLTGDPTKPAPPVETEQSEDGQDCIKQDPASKGGDKGSGLVWLLGDPEKIPPDADAPPDMPEDPTIAKALTPGESGEDAPPEALEVLEDAAEDGEGGGGGGGILKKLKTAVTDKMK